MKRKSLSNFKREVSERVVPGVQLDTIKGGGTLTPGIMLAVILIDDQM